MISISTLISFLILLGGSEAGYVTKVENVTLEGVYKTGNCDSKVSCYVVSNDPHIMIDWNVHGGPPGIEDVEKIPGFALGENEHFDHDLFKQTLKITKCYKKLDITCTSYNSSCTITLSLPGKPTNSWGLPAGAIVGIIIAILAVTIGIIACVVVVKKRRFESQRI